MRLNETERGKKRKKERKRERESKKKGGRERKLVFVCARMYKRILYI